MSRYVQIAVLFAAISLLAGCTQPAVSATPAPSPTAIAGLPTETPAIFIAETEISSFSIAGLAFLEPGAGSELVSPIHINAQIPEDAAVVRVELRGADGRLLARQLARPDGSGRLQLDLDFEIRNTRETGRLVLSADDEYGRSVQLVSIEIQLLAEGENLLLSAQDQQALSIESPQTGDRIAGGSVTVSGHVIGEPGKPLNVQLITREGRILASDDLYPQFASGSESGLFTIELSGQVETGTWVLVSLSQSENNLLIFLTSVEIWLTP